MARGSSFELSLESGGAPVSGDSRAEAGGRLLGNVCRGVLYTPSHVPLMPPQVCRRWF